MGSDAVFTMFGQNTRELEWFVKAGMTPEQALAAATTNGAALLGMEKSLGAVAPGYFADMVAVEGDPFAGHRRGDPQCPLGDEGRQSGGGPNDRRQVSETGAV